MEHLLLAEMAVLVCHQLSLAAQSQEPVVVVVVLFKVELLVLAVQAVVATQPIAIQLAVQEALTLVAVAVVVVLLAVVHLVEQVAQVSSFCGTQRLPKL
jgi:hypothetical protein